MTTITLADERRCPDCHQLMYVDGRSGVWKHYLNDLAQCVQHWPEPKEATT